MNQVSRPMPKPTAQVAPYVQALGSETAVRFLLAYGGAELYIAADPKGRSSHESFLGQDKARALAGVVHLLQKRVPLAKRWLVQMLVWQGHSIADAARKVRATDVTVSRWLAESRAE